MSWIRGHSVGVLFGVLLCLRAHGAAQADSPAQELDQIKAEYQGKIDKFQQVYAAAKTDQEREQASKLYPQAPEYAPRFLTIAKKSPGTKVELDALAWCLEKAYYDEKIANEATDLLIQHQLESKDLTPAMGMMAYSAAKNTETFLRGVIQKNPNKEEKAQAVYSLACYLKDNFREKAEDREKSRKEAEKLFETILSDYKDVNSALSEGATGQLFEIRHLSIGQTAPDIEGEDVNGVKFKLSDYRGKVVVLDFWGDW